MSYKIDRKKLYFKELFILIGIVLGILFSKFTGIYAILLVPLSFIFLFRIRKLNWLFYLIFNSVGFIVFMLVIRAFK